MHECFVPIESRFGENLMPLVCNGLPGSYVLLFVNSPTRYGFDGLTLDVGRHEVLRGPEVVRLSKLSFRLLHALVAAAPNVVTRDDLATRVWGPHHVVTPENLAKRVMILRRALGDPADAPRYIGGVRGVGYRLLADVVVDEPSPEPGEGRPAEPAPARRGDHGFAPLRAIGYIGSALAIAIVWTIAIASWPHNFDVPGREPASVLHGDRSQGAGNGSVRINVEVVDAETNSVIWSESYEGDFTADDALGIQREIESSSGDESGAAAKDDVASATSDYPMPM